MERVRTFAPPTARRRLLRLALAVTLFAAAGLVGRVTVIDREALSMVWPAAGVAALWLASGDRRTWPADAAALVAITFLVNFTTDASLADSLAFVVSNLLQVLVFVVLVRRWLPYVWGLGGEEPLHRLGDLGRLVLAATLASMVGAASGMAGLWAAGDAPPPESLLVWWGRNTISVLGLVTLGLIVGPRLLGRTDDGRSHSDVMRSRTPQRALEAGALVGVSAGLYGVLFGRGDSAPLSFLVLAISVWAGLRFRPPAVVVHGLAVGAAGLAFTIHGTGPFAEIDSAFVRALVAQVFVATAMLTGLALAFSRAERDDAIRSLAHAQRDADERARLLNAVLESMNEGLVVVEEGGRVLLSNAATQRLLGLEDVRGRMRPTEAYGLFRQDGTAVVDEDLPIGPALAGEEVPPADYHLRVESVPEGRVLEISARPLPAEHPADPPRAIVNLRDVTVDRQHRDALASFAGIVAHDLFNPLTVVNGWTEALEEEFSAGTVPAPVGLPMVARIHEASSHMRQVIGDLLAYTVARDQSLRATDVDLTAELRSLALLRIDAPSSPLITVAPGLRVWADAGLVRQLFDNLIGNAVKYVAPGVRPRVDIRGEQVGDQVVVRVTDNGIGIPDDERELVFETFHRAHRQGYQGTGLGLAICRRIADRHGGSIHAETGPDGHGTTFVVTLPASPTGQLTQAPAARPARVPHREPVEERA